MTLYFAPLEGVTDAVFRRIHHECFPGVSKYFIPFISPTQNLAFTSRDWAAIAPENNIGVPSCSPKTQPFVSGLHRRSATWAIRKSI